MSLSHFVPNYLLMVKRKKKWNCQVNNILKMLQLERPTLLSLSKVWNLGEETNERFSLLTEWE